MQAINGTYTSMMHMVPLQLEGDKPTVVNQYCNGLTGHLIIFEVAQGDKVIKVQLRLECGYQPVDVPDWPPPGNPPKKPPYNPPDNPPEEKKKKDDPQNRPKADQYDFYSPDRVNHDPDTTPTSEPESPDSYVAPDRPPDVIKTPNSNSDSSSVPDNHNNGGTESHDGKKYEVDFLIPDKKNDKKTVPIEVKSGNNKKHSSLDYYNRHFGKNTAKGIVLTKGDLQITDEYRILPLPMAYFL